MLSRFLVDEVVKKDILVELLSKHNTLPFDYRNPFLNLPNARERREP